MNIESYPEKGTRITKTIPETITEEIQAHPFPEAGPGWRNRFTEDSFIGHSAGGKGFGTPGIGIISCQLPRASCTNKTAFAHFLKPMENHSFHEYPGSHVHEGDAGAFSTSWVAEWVSHEAGLQENPYCNVYIQRAW
ncbi:MAG: hypothetical protein AB1Z16_11405 [Desulfotignum sp.]